MKKFFLITGIAVAVAGLYGFIKYRCKHKPVLEEPICGGVTRYVNEDAPKEIKSTDIVRFSCEVSLVTFVGEEDLSGCNYKFEAVVKDGAVNGVFEWYDRYGESENKPFSASASFMDDLYRIVSKYDYAKFNGEIYTVAGLPQMYGAKIDIDFASGEKVYSYDNQGNFLPLDSVKELVCLFER